MYSKIKRQWSDILYLRYFIVCDFLPATLSCVVSVWSSAVAICNFVLCWVVSYSAIRMCRMSYPVLSPLICMLIFSIYFTTKLSRCCHDSYPFAIGCNFDFVLILVSTVKLDHCCDGACFLARPYRMSYCSASVAHFGTLLPFWASSSSSTNVQYEWHYYEKRIDISSDAKVLDEHGGAVLSICVDAGRRLPPSRPLSPICRITRVPEIATRVLEVDQKA